MNELDRKLAELAFINKQDLPPNPHLPGKKVGPAVPPKPKKPQQPLVPQSYPLKQPVEPSYSSRIQTNQFYSNLPPQGGQLYSNAPTLPASAKYGDHNIQDNNYANLPRGSNGEPFSRSASAMSNNSLPRSSNASYGSGYATKNTSNFGSTPKPYQPSNQEVTYSNIRMNPQRSNGGLIYSNLAQPQRETAVYSNIPQGGSTYPNGEELPPPPPPLDITGGMADYAPCTVNTNLPPPPDDLLPPPSPVSSSYSELRRATQPGQDFHNYSMGSQASSTYESIYEPINPRPPSQISSRSNYSLYAPYSGSSSTLTGPSQSVSRIGHNKEQEIDSLTDMLVQGMGNAPSEIEEDVYGVCVKCAEKIVGENSGCTAMDQLYHIKCFTCHHCAINLQGKPFYALDGHPYCEEDYLNTLEKCCVCQKPILDRILRATGKPYHPGCFCCVVCGKSLDGIPFTVDATNRVHCIEDFHKIFAPRCWVCKQPIMPEPGEEETVRVVALDHSFHIQCYKCEDCGLVLSSEAEGRGCYPLDGHVLCKSCNAKRVQALTSHMTTEL
ncbi:thyroid receptor-interacting protein 6 [Anthonomus grandis grandis]|uniref:thyroid receptor-interacting protein 6 n=1 Tax=Anthonomus grandis grandis TaxID=2921223 RepID=UPI002165E7D9|nr:thyroid receptor-interacting protein 6 [Anthonomus grandis grandis]